MRCKLRQFQSPIVSSLQFADDRDYLLGAFSIGREFIYVFAAKISARREFVCKRLMDLWGELNRYLRNRQRLMDLCQPLGRDLIWLQILLLLKNQSYQQFFLHLHFN